MELLDTHDNMNKINQRIEFNNTLKELAKDAAWDIYKEASEVVNDEWFKMFDCDSLDDDRAFKTAVDDFVRHLANELHTIRFDNNSQPYG